MSAPAASGAPAGAAGLAPETGARPGGARAPGAGGTLIVNAVILPCTPTMPVIDRGWIHVRGERIAGLGAGAAPEAPGAEVIDAGGDLVMPGMVNPHAHLAMTLFRGLGEDVDDRLIRYILPLERRFVTEETVAAGTALAAYETIRAGVTIVADMYYFETEVARVLDRAGLRAMLGQTIADFAPPDHATIDEGFDRLAALAGACADHPRLIASAAPHAPYSTGPEVLARVARDWAGPVQIHLAETRPEMEWCGARGVTPPEMLARAGLLRPGLVAAHCMYVTEADIALMAGAGVGVAHNARSNGKAGRGIAPVLAMRAAGLPVGLATDGPMSGNTLDLFAQFAPGTMFQKIAAGTRAALPAVEVIRMATLEGARVLGLDDRVGSLEEGKAADLIRISLDAVRLHPIYDWYSMLVFAALPEDVRDVMVGGRWLMRGREVLTVERAKVMRDALQVAARFKAEMARIDAG